MQSIAMSSVLSFFWLCAIWLAKPIPLYSIDMWLLVCTAILGVMSRRKARR